ncbi:hypothetical protein HanPSC8_Chr05g0209061 [Helianthus annuus]|nr:hypothetical protein HanPSC8_Chr05g0209061 [Helianthus annuus]
MSFWRENCGSLFLTVKPRFKLSDPTILFGSYLNNTLLHFSQTLDPHLIFSFTILPLLEASANQSIHQRHH